MYSHALQRKRPTELGRERCKAAAWAWYERGAVSGTLCRQGSTALMVRGKYMRSSLTAAGKSTHENSENGSVQLMIKASKKCLPPSRFKREAEALVQKRRHVQVYADQEVARSSASTTTSLPPPSAHCPMDDPCPSDAILSAPPQDDRCWSDKLLGISSRKSTFSLEYINQELDSLILLLGKDASAGLSSQRSSLFDSFELQELLRKLGSNEGDKSEGKSAEVVEAFVPDQSKLGAMEKDPKEAHAHLNVAEAQDSHKWDTQEILGLAAATSDPAESVSEPENTSSRGAEKLYVSGCLNPAITFSESTRSSPPENIIFASPPTRPVFHLNTPPYSKQTLHDLLQWSPRSPTTTPDCHCASAADLSDSDHFYYSESPDLNSTVTAGSCSSSRCNNVKASQRHRRRRRPSLLMPPFTHSFSSALHHIPHLTHSFSHALHHLPHSLSNALHHLPSSLSNAFHQIALLPHSLSSAYKHHVASHHKDVEASPSHDAKVDAQSSHHKSFHLRHFFSFKMHHSPSHPEIAVGGTSPNIADYRSSPSATATLVHHHPKSPSRERRLSASNDYMLIYSSSKKKFSRGIVHHHHHHHYHHHYVL